jgi:hypothetical protein
VCSSPKPLKRATTLSRNAARCPRIEWRNGGRHNLGCSTYCATHRFVIQRPLPQLKRNPPGFNVANLEKIRHRFCPRVQLYAVRYG